MLARRSLSGVNMLRFFLFGGIVAIAVLILLWDSPTLRAQVAKGAAIAYLALLAVLLFLGLAM